MFYLSLILTIITVILVEFKGESKRSQYLFYSSIVLLVFISMIRFGLGADYFSYEYIYQSIDPSNLIESFAMSDNIEPLFKVIMIVFRVMEVPYIIFVGLIGTLIVLLMGNFINNISPHKHISLLLYTSTFYMVWVLSALRQGIVIALLLNVYFTENKIKSYQKILITIILFFIHPSAIFAGMMYVFSLIKLPKKYYLAIAVFSLFFQFIPKDIYIGVLENIKYLNKFIYYIDENTISFFSFTVLVRVFFFLLTYYYYDRIIEKNNNREMMNFILINYILYFALMFSSLTASRMSIYGYICLIIIVPMIKDLYTNNLSQKIIVSLVILFSLVSFNKELGTLIEQTEYQGTKYEVNFETIINKDRNKFSEMYNFETNNNELNMIYTNRYLESRIIPNEIEAEYTDTMTHLSVRFDKENLFGVINEEGKIVELPEELVRAKIVDRYIQTVYNPYDFSTKIYRAIGTKENISFHDTISLMEKEIVLEIQNDVYWYEKEDFPLEDLKLIDQIKDRNFGSVKSAQIVKNELNESIHYLQINTPLASYYTILNNDNQMIVENLYTKIEPYDESGIFKGYTKESVHFINKKGNVIWIETRK